VLGLLLALWQARPPVYVLPLCGIVSVLSWRTLTIKLTPWPSALRLVHLVAHEWLARRGHALLASTQYQLS
jgi:hypothetical protein